MWKYYDEGARNMGVESSPYYHHAVKAENFYRASPSQYTNGNLSEETVHDWDDRRPFNQHYQRYKSTYLYNNATRSQNPSFIEHTPQYKQRHPAETEIIRKRLKLDSDTPNEPQQNNELTIDNDHPVNSSSESKAEKLWETQPASFFNIHLDNETLNNLKKILDSSEISAIKTEKPPDLQKNSSENEAEKPPNLQMKPRSSETEKLPDLQKQSSGNKEEKLPDLQKQSSDNRTESLSGLEKIDIPFHSVQLDTATWENLKKITTSPVCLKTSDNVTKSTISQDDSLASQSTKSEILTESSLSQGDSSFLAKQTPKVSNSVCSDIVPNKRKTTGDPWFLNEKDILNHTSNKTPGSVNRVRKSSLTCHSCGEKGHSARFCTKVKKLPVCFICAKEGHNGEFCRDVICSRCLHMGHPPERCRWFERENSVCTLCKFPGHYTQECPDFWRRYHLTDTPGRIVCPPRHMVTDRIFCYNCAEEGHLGHDCEDERIDPYSFPYYPFIVDYSIPHV